MGTWIHSACDTGRRIFSTLSITGSLIRRCIDAACPRSQRVRMDVEAALSWAIAGKYARNIGRLNVIYSSRGDHDDERIRGADSASSAITASNLHRGPGTQSGRKAESTPLG